jgi:hypothetical protein
MAPMIDGQNVNCSLFTAVQNHDYISQTVVPATHHGTSNGFAYSHVLSQSNIDRLCWSPEANYYALSCTDLALPNANLGTGADPSLQGQASYSVT